MQDTFLNWEEKGSIMYDFLNSMYVSGARSGAGEIGVSVYDEIVATPLASIVGMVPNKYTQFGFGSKLLQ